MRDVQLTEEEVGLTEQDVQLKPRGISAFQTRVTPKLGSPSTPIHVVQAGNWQLETPIALVALYGHLP